MCFVSDGDNTHATVRAPESGRGRRATAAAQRCAAARRLKQTLYQGHILGRFR